MFSVSLPEANLVRPIFMEWISNPIYCGCSGCCLWILAEGRKWSRGHGYIGHIFVVLFSLLIACFARFWVLVVSCCKENRNHRMPHKNELLPALEQACPSCKRMLVHLSSKRQTLDWSQLHLLGWPDWRGHRITFRIQKKGSMNTLHISSGKSALVHSKNLWTFCDGYCSIEMLR